MFSTNQVIQFYVSPSGAEEIKTTANGKLFVEFANQADGMMRSDLIDPNKIMYVTYKAASADTTARKGFILKLNSAINSGAPVAGEQYILKLNYRGFIGNEDTYQKIVEVYVTPDIDTEAKFLKAVAKAFLMNMVEVSPMYELYTVSSGTTLGTKITEANVDSASYTNGLAIVEPQPEWSLGLVREMPAIMELSTSTITVNSVEYNNWLDASSYKFQATSLTYPNTHRVADLEYFALGERGAQGGLAGWPYVVTPKYLVDASDANGYNILDVHYFFSGCNHAVQKSEKDLIIVAKSAVDLSDLKAAFEAYLPGAVADAVGMPYTDNDTLSERVEALEEA